MKVLFASSEVEPFVKTGGLADVASALPVALGRLGHDVSVVLPRYGSVKKERLEDAGIDVAVTMDGREYVAQLLRAPMGENATAYFLENEELYGRPNPYGDADGDYADNDARFIFFNRAVMELPGLLGMRPDIVHANDWQCGLMPLYLKRAREAGDPLFTHASSVFTIHNLAYQGHFSKKAMRLTGLPDELFSADGVEMYGKLALLKSGILFADEITAVSPTYAREILGKELGFGLEKVLGKRKKYLTGILNGIDVETWSPMDDPLISARYGPDDVAPKAACRSALLREFGLEDIPSRPVVGIVSRLIEQKGFDLVVAAGERLLALDFALVAIGTGQPEYESYLKRLAERVPGRVAVTIGYDNGLAHRIEAGSDIFLMPSHFEPCGLNQMYSLRYGTVPVVRATGGLADTVREWDPKRKEGNGFVFKKPTAQALVRTLQRAIKTYREKDAWRKIVANGMAADFSWDRSARRYLQLYEKVVP